ncbi:MAG: T9SS type A sorting domain-containing protein, partial [Bacteroidota bacterium]|nr:T9SS type A sorting domain-containing protein [Bacteroidota bacterium]
SYQDSLIYVLGGDHGYVDNHRIFLYNADNDSWRELDSFQLPSLAGALTIFRNKIIYVGGADSHSAYSTTYIGNIQLDHSIIWHRGTDYPLGTRFRWNAAPWGEKGIIVLNGCRTDFWNSENECYLYNPDNDTWHIMPPKNFNTCGTSITSLKINNKMKLFALGGYILNDITNYNEILVDSITVPVELTSFASTISKNSVTIKWATATEKNNYGFEIERKDLKTEFKRIGFIKGKGTTTEVNNYSYSDNNLAPNAYNYRIKQIDYDGNYKYYYLANEVNLQYTLTYSLAQNYPNPFNPGTTIKYAIAKAGVVTLKLYDILGKEKAVLVNERKEPGNYVYAFKNNNLSSGIYFYTLKVNDYAQTKKMIILK